MNSSGSVLWRDSTTHNDRAIVGSIVNEVVAGGADHKEQCVDKIMTKIQEKDWQKKYHHRGFVFSVFYALSIKNPIEISFGLSAQAMDALYYLLSSANKTFDAKASFSKKVMNVFEEIYGDKMPADTANLLRIMRNDVMHTGAIMGITGSRQNPKDTQTILSYFSKYHVNAQQKTTPVQDVVGMAVTFTFLVRDMVVRTLGVEWDDLNRNLRPPSKLVYFTGAIK